MNAESELFLLKRNTLLLVTIVCFDKMRQNKFSVKCYDFYMLFATQIENELLDAIYCQPKRKAFKIWLCVVLGEGESKCQICGYWRTFLFCVISIGCTDFGLCLFVGFFYVLSASLIFLVCLGNGEFLREH